MNNKSYKTVTFCKTILCHSAPYHTNSSINKHNFDN